MPKDSSIRNFSDLYDYGVHLVQESKNLQEIFDDIRRHAEWVSERWDDKSQESLMEHIRREAKTIQNISETVDRFGKAVKNLADDKERSTNRFCR